MRETAALSILLSFTVACMGLGAAHGAVEYPGVTPGSAACAVDKQRMSLSNDVIRCLWELEDGRAESLEITDVQAAKAAGLDSGHMPRIVLQGGRIIDLALLVPTRGFHCGTIKADPNSPRAEDAHGGRRISARFVDNESGLTVNWLAQLRDGSNYINQTLVLKCKSDVKIEKIEFLDATIKNARQVGEVSGSVVLCGNVFLAVEHPLAENVVDKKSQVRCSLPRSMSLASKQPQWRCSSVMGVVPQAQLRRGFLYYLERRRAHPYRPFLHYNSWYHLNIGKPNYLMTEKECLDTIEHIGRELVEKRDVKLDAFVWDDGWNDFNSLWDFHDGFPRGFSETMKAGKRYGAATGVWLSPWGGYGPPAKARLAYGRKHGLEINNGRFAMSGPKYYAAFRNSCMRMIRRYNAAYFKFDGLGGSNMTSGAEKEFADDANATLRLVRELRREKPDIFISATTGTWPSPFWTMFADSIWRQGHDVDYHGAGNNRQRWITYRDMLAYQRIVRRGPLYPLNSLMFHGLCIGEHHAPSKMPRHEKSVVDETWMMFGCGTGLQELYISPHLLTPKMWDELAKAAKWSRANRDVLVDTHWVGGDPGEAQVYGFGAWSKRKGILVLRNPADKTQDIEFSPRRDWELPQDAATNFKLRIIHGKCQNGLPKTIAADSKMKIVLEPFGIIIVQGTEVEHQPESANAKADKTGRLLLAWDLHPQANRPVETRTQSGRYRITVSAATAGR